MLPDPGDRAPAPEPLRRVQAFVNTVDFENGREELLRPDDLRGPLGLRGSETLSPADLRHALAVREALRELLRANNGGAVSPGALATLDRAAAAAHLTVRFGPRGAEVVPQASGLDAAFGRLLAIVQRTIADGTWPRLKACPRDVCRWVFYDRSRNATGKWCAMAVCGNRTKKARLRERA